MRAGTEGAPIGKADERLETERRQTQLRLRALAADFDAIVSASVDANSDDEHDPEGSTIAFEREQIASLRAHAEAHLADLERAVARVADGSYGICSVCQGPIGGERLRALPVTELCTPCAGGHRSLLGNHPGGFSVITRTGER